VHFHGAKLLVKVEEIILAPPEAGQVLNLREIFGADVPVELEIGSGKGTFLLNRARAHPAHGFLGIEWANKIFQYAADRMARWGMSNVRMMRTDARHLVIHHLPPSSLTMLHIYHPDPWPKKRHHKRRLFQRDFVAAVATALVPGGRLAVQTDHAEYFEYIGQVLKTEPRLAVVPFDVPEAGVSDGRVGTNYEVKYLREGRAIYQIALMRV
jgi:tRNA (guanine-N7-)-methyltransferase